jgi:hypothetical protein
VGPHERGGLRHDDNLVWRHSSLRRISPAGSSAQHRRLAAVAARKTNDIPPTDQLPSLNDF